MLDGVLPRSQNGEVVMDITFQPTKTLGVYDILESGTRKPVGTLWITDNQTACENLGTFADGIAFFQGCDDYGPFSETQTLWEAKSRATHHYAERYICNCGLLKPISHPCPVCNNRERTWAQEHGIADDSITGGIADCLEYGDSY